MEELHRETIAQTCRYADTETRKHAMGSNMPAQNCGGIYKVWK